ncbi:allene oxide synthase-lipoxygenase protein-like isoform X2 [Corticium candelabrum]|uniref:allene oxide synthase-lipoxygenase protein-like isoform X2 n=1 Tax=Corticium candelabrum TaxID=121492 RepID=UPI002E260ABF|nr:allene oxide synthase-lipoxygenase protein-like isoform X2 [Corticium candelabrum]
MTEDWSNDTYRYITERSGATKCEEMKQSEYPSIPEPGIFSGIRLWASSKMLNALVQYKSYKKGRRLTHTLGVGGVGIATIVDNVDIPENAFFVSGRVFPVRIRHANLTFDDDRTLDVRSASLKFADKNVDSPLDLVMNTGDRCPFWNGPTVTDFQASRPAAEEKKEETEKKLREWMDKNSAYYYNAIQSIRRAPTSYSDMIYHSQVTMELKDKEDKTHHVRFRLIPADYTGSESGLPDAEDQKEPWKFAARPTDSRPSDYLRQDYTNKLNAGSVKYLLQIQLHGGQQDPNMFNMGKPWTNSPWRNLANVSILYSLLPSVVEVTCYNIAHLPDCMAIPEADSFQDYRSIGVLRRGVYEASQKGRLSSGPPKFDEPAKISYKVSVVTSNEGGAGYDGEVFITISGSNGRTAPTQLEKSRIFSEDFSSGDRDAFTVEGIDVGDISFIQINLERNNEDGWALDMISIEKDGHEETFPVYQWIYDQLIVRSGHATLPFQDDDKLRAIRLLEKQQWRARLPWRDWESMPSHADIDEHGDLPRELQFMNEKNKDFQQGRNQGLINLMLNKFVGIFEDVESLHDFVNFFRVGVGKVPAVADRWRSDREFGRQFLQGTHPNVFKQITELPDKFPLQEKDAAAVLGRGVTLQDALQAGHVYLADFKELQWIKTPPDRFVTPAMCLFYVNAAGNFIPMAIQLYQEPGPQNPIFTPQDVEADWLCARFYLRCADAQLHQMRDHLLMTHLIMEPFAVSLYRNLARVHPVFKLLVPHIRYTMAINTIGRKTLIGEGGIADKGLAVGKGGHIDLIKKTYRAFDYRNIVFPKSLENRGVADMTILPNYFYRDDGVEG